MTTEEISYDQLDKAAPTYITVHCVNPHDTLTFEADAWAILSGSLSITKFGQLVASIPQGHWSCVRHGKGKITNGR